MHLHLTGQILADDFDEWTGDDFSGGVVDQGGDRSELVFGIPHQSVDCAFVSQVRVAPYTTSKTALLGLTRSIAVDYAPQIRCVAVCPGSVDTPMLRDAIRQSPNPDEVLDECVHMHPLKRIGSADEIAEVILYLCSDKAGFITGQPIRIDGGLGLSIGGSKRD